MARRLGRRPGGLTSSDILVGNYLDEQRTAPLACVLQLLLIRPARRTDVITMHPAEPPFRVHFLDGDLCGRPSFGLSKADCGYKFQVNRLGAAFGTALTLLVPNRAGR